MHRVDDDTLVTPDLLRQFIQFSAEEGGNGQHFALIQKSDGSMLEHNPHSPELDAGQALFARDVVDKLNRELHHDGAWMILFTHPGVMKHLLLTANDYARFCLLWIDGDGDLRVFIDWVAGQSEDQLAFTDVLSDGIDVWIDLAEGAWRMNDMLNQQTLDLKPSQTYKKALGEKPPSQH